MPQFATFCHQVPHVRQLPGKMPHSATICRPLHFGVTGVTFCANFPSPNRPAIPIVVEPLNVEG